MADPAVTILFEGQPLACRPGQSVAAALWDHGVKVLSHSPKYGRPRGASCARGHCMGCLMRIDGVPNVRACNAPVREGQRVERQDAGAVYGRPMQAALANTGHLLPVGFYYKWFTKPTAVAKLFMRAIRPVAGIGRLPDEAAWRGAPPPPRSRDLGRWNTFSLDLSPLMNQDPSAVYRVKLFFRKEYALFGCENPSGDDISKYFLES
ncbi:(2Fe-2S)-binding protein [bacterium]|nr:(2Fe-2S)-binding protein [bacterium]